jgi:hypothetical protein
MLEIMRQPISRLIHLEPYPMSLRESTQLIPVDGGYATTTSTMTHRYESGVHILPDSECPRASYGVCIGFVWVAFTARPHDGKTYTSKCLSVPMPHAITFTVKPHDGKTYGPNSAGHSTQVNMVCLLVILDYRCSRARLSTLSTRLRPLLTTTHRYYSHSHLLVRRRRESWEHAYSLICRGRSV